VAAPIFIQAQTPLFVFDREVQLILVGAGQREEHIPGCRFIVVHEDPAMVKKLEFKVVLFSI
jgi:hypothetical protein